VPVDEAAKLWESGVFIPYSIYCLNARGENQDPCGIGFSDGDPDGRGVAIENTLVPVPWTRPAGAQVLMQLVDEKGAPSDVEPRAVVAAVLERFAERGLTPVVAFELEFYLFEDQPVDASGPMVAQLPKDRRESGGVNVYDFAALDSRQDFFAAVRKACAVQNINASVVTSEYASGQYEINLNHRDDALAAADECVLFRRLIESVARAKGMRASFMAKPRIDWTGSGMHLHMSLKNTSGENVFDPATGDAQNSLSHAIGGVLDTMAAGMSMFSPNHNGFRRYQPDAFVPVNRSWANNNRSVACRIPAGGGSSTRLEHRVAGADANPYLVLACLLAGVHHGLVNAIDPGPEMTGNACGVRDGEVPWNVPDSLAATSSSVVLNEYLGRRYVDVYTQTKRQEYESFLADMTEREYAWYL